jgi:hypothetical protein
MLRLLLLLLLLRLLLVFWLLLLLCMHAQQVHQCPRHFSNQAADAPYSTTRKQRLSSWHLLLLLLLLPALTRPALHMLPASYSVCLTSRCCCRCCPGGSTAGCGPAAAAYSAAGGG